jgi:hypothetical protein
LLVKMCLKIAESHAGTAVKEDQHYMPGLLVKF